MDIPSICYGYLKSNKFFYKLIRSSKVGGVQNFFVEMDPETFAPSAEFLKKA